MERTTTTHQIAQEISHRVGLDSAHTASPAPDVDCPRGDAHESHEWVIGPAARWLECDRCAVRDYYPGAASPCANAGATAARGRPGTIWTTMGAINALRLDLYAFFAWWRGRPDLGDARPSLDEWAAEFLEWRTGRTGRAERRG